MNSFLIFLCFSCSVFITSHTMHSSFCAVFWGPLFLACTSADFTLHTHVFPTFE